MADKADSRAPFHLIPEGLRCISEEFIRLNAAI